MQGGTVAYMPSAPSPALLAGAAPDPHWSGWREAWDGMRRPLAVCLTCAAIGGCVHTVVDRIVGSNDRPTMRGRGAAVPDDPSPQVSVEPLPLQGTATGAFVAPPPYSPVDPNRPEPLTLDVNRMRRIGG